MANIPIGKICKTHILDTYHQMQKNGVGNGSIILLHKVLNAIFNYAEFEDMVRRNYAKGYTKELGIWQVQQFLKRNKIYKTLPQPYKTVSL